MEAYKAGSCRQAMFTDLKIHNSFTLENSFFKQHRNRDHAVEKPPETGTSPSKVITDDESDCCSKHSSSAESWTNLRGGEAYDH